jgi:hypothetical protein
MAKGPEILKLAEFLIYLTLMLCKNTTFEYKAFVVGSLLLCKIQLVPLVPAPSFLRIDSN